MARTPAAPARRAQPPPMAFTPKPPSFGPSALTEDPHQMVTVSPPATEVAELLALQASLPSLGPASLSGFHAALLANAESEGTLSGLSRMVEELSGGVIRTQRVNDRLHAELAALRELLGNSNEQQLHLKHRIAALEQEVSAARLDAELAFDSLTEQHDVFLKALLDEHEEQLAAARARELSAELRAIEAEEELRERKAERADPSEVVELGRRLEAERELSREALKKLRNERDEAEARAQHFARRVAELEQEALSPAAKVAGGSSPGAAWASASVSAAPNEVGPIETIAEGPSAPVPSSPATLTQASPSADSASVSLHPPLRPKPDASSRPLIGYAVGRDGVATETLEGARISSKPPKTRG